MRAHIDTASNESIDVRRWLWVRSETALQSGVAADKKVDKKVRAPVAASKDAPPRTFTPENTKGQRAKALCLFWTSTMRRTEIRPEVDKDHPGLLQGYGRG